jgi:hypothetical protein
VFDLYAQALARVLVNDRQHLKLAAIFGSVHHKIVAPYIFLAVVQVDNLDDALGAEDGFRSSASHGLFGIVPRPHIRSP